MKKAGQIIMVIITVLLGMSLFTTVLTLVLSVLLEVGAIAFGLGGEIVMNEFLKSLGLYGDEATFALNLMTALASIWGIIAASIIFIFSLLGMGVGIAEFVISLIATIMSFKAKNKSGVVFPAIVSFIFAAISFINGGQILFTIFYALPGIFFMLLKDKDFEQPAPKIEEKKEEAKEETPVEKVEAETVA